MTTMEDLKTENALLRRYVDALHRSPFNSPTCAIVFVSDEMAKKAGYAAIGAAFGQELSND